MKFSASQLSFSKVLILFLVIFQIPQCKNCKKRGSAQGDNHSQNRILFDYFQKSFKEEAIAQQQAQDSNYLSDLTQREEEVLDLLTQGITYKGVAQQLFISETTVKTHVNNIFQKLQVNDRTQAVLYAINHGFKSKSQARMSNASLVTAV